MEINERREGSEKESENDLRIVFPLDFYENTEYEKFIVKNSQRLSQRIIFALWKFHLSLVIWRKKAIQLDWSFWQ